MNNLHKIHSLSLTAREKANLWYQQRGSEGENYYKHYLFNNKVYYCSSWDEEEGLLFPIADNDGYSATCRDLWIKAGTPEPNYGKLIPLAELGERQIYTGGD